MWEMREMWENLRNARIARNARRTRNMRKMRNARNSRNVRNVRNARNVYVDIGAVDEYATWVRTLDFVDVSDAELDQDTYQSAENKYLENDVENATVGFQKYLKKLKMK